MSANLAFYPGKENPGEDKCVCGKHQKDASGSWMKHGQNKQKGPGTMRSNHALALQNNNQKVHSPTPNFLALLPLLLMSLFPAFIINATGGTDLHFGF